MKNAFYAVLAISLSAVNSFGAVDLARKTIECTGIRALYEGEITVRVTQKSNEKAKLQVLSYGKLLTETEAEKNATPGNLRYDLFAGKIEHDSEGNQVFDGLHLSYSSNSAKLYLALNGVGQSLRKFVPVQPFSQLEVLKPSLGKFEITNCRN